MSIAAYFISAFPHNTHIVYWVSIVSAELLLSSHSLFDVAYRLLSTLFSTSLCWHFQPRTSTRGICGQFPGSSHTSGSQPSSSPLKTTTPAQAPGRILPAPLASLHSKRLWRLSLSSHCRCLDPEILRSLLMGRAQLHQPCWRGPRGTSSRCPTLQDCPQCARREAHPRPYCRRRPGYSACCLSQHSALYTCGYDARLMMAHA